MRRKKAKRPKPKYRIGRTVYCRPWLRSHGLSVYKCLVTQVNQIGDDPYYSLQVVDTQLNLFVMYESEISRRKERLIKEAKKELEKKYAPFLEALNYHLLQLQALKSGREISTQNGKRPE